MIDNDKPSSQSRPMEITEGAMNEYKAHRKAERAKMAKGVPCGWPPKAAGEAEAGLGSRTHGDAKASEPEAIEHMTAAYEHALKVLQLTDRTDPITELVARKIIEIAEVGERDPDRLCARALAALKQMGPEKSS